MKAAKLWDEGSYTASTVYCRPPSDPVWIGLYNAEGERLFYYPNPPRSIGFDLHWNHWQEDE